MAVTGRARFSALAVVTGVLSACSTLSVPGGIDLINDAPSAEQVAPTAVRPEPDARGVITYPNYQVAVAERGDTIGSIATRLGLDAQALADKNGRPLDGMLRAGELVLLPERVAVAGQAGNAAPGGEVDVATLAGSALDRVEGTAPRTDPAPSASASAAAPEPTRHLVRRGETAYSIARQYGVSVRALGEWNGLDSALTVREGQTLLIPVATAEARQDEPQTPQPGQGSPTPLPPSAAAPQPAEDLPPVAASNAAAASTAGAGTIAAEQTAASDTARLLQPVSGQIIRSYQPGTSDGVGFGAPAGTTVRAAAAGTVAAITRDTEQVPIVVLRHDDNLLTVYANVAGIAVSKGTSVSRGQKIAEVREGDPSFLHFEVRQGFESVDPVPYLTD